MIVGDVVNSEWESMTIDELFSLREVMQDVLSKRLKAKKGEIERRLQMHNLSSVLGPPSQTRRSCDEA